MRVDVTHARRPFHRPVTLTIWLLFWGGVGVSVVALKWNRLLRVTRWGSA